MPPKATSAWTGTTQDTSDNPKKVPRHLIRASATYLVVRDILMSRSGVFLRLEKANERHTTRVLPCWRPDPSHLEDLTPSLAQHPSNIQEHSKLLTPHEHMTKREHGSDYETVRCSFSSKAPGKLPSIKLIFKKPAGSTPQTRLAGLRNLLSQLSLSELRAFQTAYTPRGEFELFRKLPPELRRMIWRTAMPHQRVVELIYHHKDIVYGWPTQDWDYWYEDFYSTPRNFKFRTHEEVPVVFQVCQESRREASKKYTLRLDTNLRRSLNLIDPVNDMLYITSFEDGVRQRAIIDSKIWKDEAYRQIKHLSITMNLWTSTLLGTWGDIVPSNGRYPLDKFTSLRDFTLVVHAHNCDQSYENRDRTRELGLVDTPAEYLSAARPDVNIVAERAKLESEFAYFVAQNPRCGPRQVKTAILTVGGTPCCIHPPAEDEAAAEGTEAEGGIDEAEGGQSSTHRCGFPGRTTQDFHGQHNPSLQNGCPKNAFSSNPCTAKHVRNHPAKTFLGA
ncbi:unnamed protein product [Diplocarpon coronariae]